MRLHVLRETRTKDFSILRGFGTVVALHCAGGLMGPSANNWRQRDRACSSTERERAARSRPEGQRRGWRVLLGLESLIGPEGPWEEDGK